MSLTAARNIAYSALMTTQVKMNVTSSNIANADTAGYTKKTAVQTANILGGIGAGTTITGITSNVDKLLLRSLMDAATQLGAAETTASYTDRLQSLFGSVSSTDDTGTSLANTIASLTTALADLAGTPESESLQSIVVDTLDTLAAQMRDTSAGIQALRADADDDIETKVGSVNDALNAIDELNEQISRASARGQSTADLEDQRSTAVESIATLMNVTSFVDSSGQMQIYTAGGQALLDGAVHELDYDSVGKVTDQTVYSAIPPSGFDAISVDGVDITSQIGSGEIGALIELRDVTLPAAQSELDELASELADTLNAVHNQGTALPPPASLTGSATVAATDAFSATGTVRFAVTDADGNLVSYQDIDLSTCSTVGALVSAIDGIAGMSATIDSEGHLQVTADTSGQGIAIGEIDSAVGTDALGLSDWFGLNDLVTATGASDFAVRSDILSDKSLLATATLDAASALTVGGSVLSVGSSTMAEGLCDALTGTHEFDAAGRISATSSSFSDYAADIVSANATAASRALSTLNSKETTYATLSETMSSQTGVNLDEETAQLADLENMYTAAATLMQTINDMFQTLLDMAASA